MKKIKHEVREVDNIVLIEGEEVKHYFRTQRKEPKSYLFGLFVIKPCDYWTIGEPYVQPSIRHEDLIESYYYEENDKLYEKHIVSFRVGAKEYDAKFRQLEEARNFYNQLKQVNKGWIDIL